MIELENGVTISQCPRCGQEHHVKALQSKKFSRPVKIGEFTFDEWGLCPTTQEPVLLQMRRSIFNEATIDILTRATAIWRDQVTIMEDKRIFEEADKQANSERRRRPTMCTEHPLTASDRAALAECRRLAARHPDHTFTCTELGEQLWGMAHRNRQSYARPAGKVIARLKRLGLVEENPRKHGERSRLAYTCCGM